MIREGGASNSESISQRVKTDLSNGEDFFSGASFIQHSQSQQRAQPKQDFVHPQSAEVPLPSTIEIDQGPSESEADDVWDDVWEDEPSSSAPIGETQIQPQYQSNDWDDSLWDDDDEPSSLVAIEVTQNQPQHQSNSSLWDEEPSSLWDDKSSPSAAIESTKNQSQHERIARDSLWNDEPSKSKGFREIQNQSQSQPSSRDSLWDDERSNSASIKPTLSKSQPQQNDGQSTVGKRTGESFQFRTAQLQAFSPFQACMEQVTFGTFNQSTIYQSQMLRPNQSLRVSKGPKSKPSAEAGIASSPTQLPAATGFSSSTSSPTKVSINTNNQSINFQSQPLRLKQSSEISKSFQVSNIRQHSFQNDHEVKTKQRPIQLETSTISTDVCTLDTSKMDTISEEVPSSNVTGETLSEEQICTRSVAFESHAHENFVPTRRTQQITMRSTSSNSNFFHYGWVQSLANELNAGQPFSKPKVNHSPSVQHKQRPGIQKMKSVLINKKQDQNPPAEKNDEEEYYCSGFRDFCGSIVNNTNFQAFIIFLILLNSACMGIQTFKFVKDNPKLADAMELSDLAFLIIFTVEIILQFGYHRFRLFLDGWLAFDFIIVVLSWSLNQVQIFRSFRIFRAFRLVARYVILRNLMAAVMDVLPRVGAIFWFLLLVLYIYAVMCTVLFKDLYAQNVTSIDYFSRLDTSMFTLFQCVTLDWADISREVMTVYPLAKVIFYTFVSMTAFILYSLIVAVVCQAVDTIEHEDEVDPHLELQLVKGQMFELQRRLESMQRNHLKLTKSVHTLMRQVEIDPDIVTQIQSINSETFADETERDTVLEHNKYRKD